MKKKIWLLVLFSEKNLAISKIILTFAKVISQLKLNLNYGN